MLVTHSRVTDPSATDYGWGRGDKKLVPLHGESEKNWDPQYPGSFSANTSLASPTPFPIFAPVTPQLSSTVWGYHGNCILYRLMPANAAGPLALPGKLFNSLHFQLITAE